MDRGETVKLPALLLWTVLLGTGGGPVVGLKPMEAKSEIALVDGGRAMLSYPAMPYDAETFKKLRADAAFRERFNQGQLLHQGMELTIDRPVRVAGVDLEPDTYRIGLVMDSGGAFGLSLVRPGGREVLPLDLYEDDRVVPYLTVSLTPDRRGAFALRFAWGKEYGTCSFFTR